MFLLPEDPFASSGFLKIAAKPGKRQDAWKAPSLQQTKTKSRSHGRQDLPVSPHSRDGHVSALGGSRDAAVTGGGGGKEEDLGHWNFLS